MLLFLDERNEHILLIESDTISENNRCPSRVLDKESVRVLQRFCEKPFVVPKALKGAEGEGKKVRAEKNLNFSYLLISFFLWFLH